MKIKTASILATTLVLGLALVPAASAGPGHKYGHAKYKHGYKHGHGADGLIGLAWEVEQSARYVHRAAEDTAHHASFFEDRALARLHVLEREARQFRRAIERRPSYARDTRHAYLDLRDAFYDAEQAVRRLHAVRPVEREFERLAYLMDRLEHRYDARAGLRHGHVRQRVPARSRGSVRIGKSWRGGHASVGFVWDD